MSGTPFFVWLVTVSNQAAILGINLIVQTTVIIGIGLITAFAFRHKGAVVQSFILRAFLVAAFLSPLIIIAGRAPSIPRITIQIPQIQTRKNFSINDMRDSKRPKKENVVLTQKHESDYTPNTSVKAEENTSPSSSTPVPYSPSTSSSQKYITTENSRYSGNIFAVLYILFFVGWAAVSLFLLLRILAAHLYIWRLRRTAFPAKSRFQNICKIAASEMHMTSPPIFQSSSVKIPFLTGLFRPAIFLPLGKEEISLPCREISIHELSHLKRRDPLWNLLWHFGIVMLPFQPLMWILARGIEETSDYVCDDYVVQYTGTHHSYAVNLADLARIYHSPGLETVAGVGFLSFKSSLRRRIGRILDSSRAIYLRVKMSVVVYVSSVCICAAFLAGLIGIRGKSFAQIRKIPETISKGAIAAVIYGAGVMKEQVRETIEVVSHDKKEDGDSKLAENDNSIIDNKSPGENEIPILQPDNMNAIDGNETANLTGSQNVAPLGSATIPVHSEAEMNGIGASVSEEAAKGEKSAAGKLPEKFSSKSANSHSAQFVSDFHELSSAITDKGEMITAKTGPVKISVPGGLPSGLRESLESGQQNPVWSPLGKVIAFTGSGGRGIYVVPVNGGNPVLLCDNTQIQSSGADETKELARTLCFSPDGRELTFVNYVSEKKNTAKSASSESSPEPVIESLNVLSGERRVIAEGANEGSWSRDGKYFVYAKSDSYGISILDISTGKRRVISETGFSPRLTPDGLSIIYIDQEWPEVFYQLFRVPLAGGKPEQLTTDGNWWGPEISPDGEWVLCTGYGISQLSQYAIFRIFNIRERMSYFIRVEGAETAEMGAWSPTGRQFCYTRIGDMIKDGFTSRRSTIFIDNFQQSSLNRPTAEKAKPSEFKLVGNFPNPFNPSTTIRFSLPSAGQAELDVYNMMGQKIRSLVSGRLEAGKQSIVWNGRDQQNRPVSSGMYVARLKMEGHVETLRMTLVK
jgi:beta-lactamase regulating signal transducer with metallopeptidase domain